MFKRIKESLSKLNPFKGAVSYSEIYKINGASIADVKEHERMRKYFEDSLREYDGYFKNVPYHKK